MSPFEVAISMSNVLYEVRTHTDPEILKEVEAERAQEEKEDAELLKKGIVRSRLCDPFDVMRIAKKIKEKEKKDG